MLRNVLVISDGGLVLFSKEFVNAVPQPRLVGSLLTAMLEFSTNNVGAPVCYIELSTVAVSICSTRPTETNSAASSAAGVASHSPSLNPMQSAKGKPEAPQVGSYPGAAGIDRYTSPAETPKATPRRAGAGGSLTCALFHDVDDGPELGRLIATELLNAFREQFGASLAKVGGGTPHINLNEFDPFHARIPSVLRGLVVPMLGRLSEHKGIVMALLLTDDSHIAYCTADGIDGLGLGANLVALTNLAEDAMSLRSDVFRSVVIEGGGSTRLMVRRLPSTHATLVAQCRTNVAPSLCNQVIADSAAICVKYFNLMDNLHLDCSL